MNKDKPVNITRYDINGVAVSQTQKVFRKRGDLLKFVNVPLKGVAAMTLNNQPVIYDTGVISRMKIDHEYYLNSNLETFDKKTGQPVVVPVDIIGRLVAGREKK